MLVAACIYIYIYIYISEVGKNTEGARPGIQAQRPRTRTARTTRQINGARLDWWLGRFWRNVFLFRPVRVQRPIGVNHVVGTKSAPFSYTCHKCLRWRKGEGIPRLVSRYKNKGFVNSWYFQVWRMSIKPKELQWFWWDQKSPWHPKARLALQKYGFREFMILSSLKNVNKT